MIDNRFASLTPAISSSLVVFSLLLAAPGALAQGSSTQKSVPDGQLIEQLTGAKGQADKKEGVFKVSMPRSDLQVTAAGIKIPTSMGLTSWAAFEGAPQHTMVMGDLCLTEEQVNPVMSVALENGLEVTALHNHFFWDSPRIMFMHIGGMGDQKALATAVGKVFTKIEETSGAPPKTQFPGIDPASSSST